MAETLTAIDAVDKTIARNFAPGQEVTMYLGLPRDISQEELTRYRNSLVANGAPISGPVELGSTQQYKNALKLTVSAPNYHGVGQIPLVVMLVLALGVLGISAYTGVTIANTIKENAIPLAIIGGGLLLGLALVMARRPTQTELQAGPVRTSYRTA